MKKEKKAKVNIYRRNTYDISQTLEGVVGAVYNMKISGEDGRLLDRFTRTVVPGRLRSGGEARIGTIRSCWKSFFQEEKKGTSLQQLNDQLCRSLRRAPVIVAGTTG